MNILILGGGGREHAFCWKLSKSKFITNIFIAPGNAGTSELGKNLDISVNDFLAIKDEVIKNKIDIVLVGPEDPLVNGIHDFFLSDKIINSVPVIGPTKKAAMLEGSKDFAKKFMERNSIPTAKHATFDKKTVKEGHKFLDTLKSPYVLKADGLAAGKGVLIIDDLAQAKEELTEMLVGGKFGLASGKVVVEEFLKGIELSCFVIADGKSYLTLPMAKDYKRIGEGDTGLNTGGMGAVSPVPFVDESFSNKIDKEIIKPTIEGLFRDKIDFVGFIFIGLIKVQDSPYVIEYNVRMGDPETQVVLPRIKNDFGEILLSISSKKISEIKLEIEDKFATTICAVSDGYPESYQKGKKIIGINKVQDSKVFHAGTSSKGMNIFTSGGRVLAITSLEDRFKDSVKKSYEELKKINFDGINYRKDIGFDL
ncbi:MAG: phosphoribosylamine--glycine ligase [Flavobacteriaceae bacterium]|nr:phosphoribosylamine--glycine ligase [Flavobacteriaceae bacterium]